MAVAPFASLCGDPVRVLAASAAARPARRASRRRRPRGPGPRRRSRRPPTDLSLRHGAGFAVAVVGIMLSEQTLMNAGVLIVAANSGAAALTGGLTGFVFNVMLIVRAPLQLFQAIQTSILPHLAGLEARESPEEFHRAIRHHDPGDRRLRARWRSGCWLIGPPVMTALLGNKGFHYGRFGLALVGLGMGLHLVSGTLNQAALARGRAALAAVAWLIAAALFVAVRGGCRRSRPR